MAGFVLVMICSFAWTHRHHVASAVATPALEPSGSSFGNYTEARDAQQMVTVTGPMADYVSGQKAGEGRNASFHRLQADGQRSCWRFPGGHESRAPA